jgi:DHA1 family multidrug resistance protein-like MFS transporter
MYIRDDLRLDSKWIAIAAMAFILIEGVMKSPFGILGDRIGRKKLILAGPAVSIFTAVLTPAVHNPFLLVALRILDGLGAAALWPAAFSLIGDYVPEERRAKAMSFFNLAYLLGLAMGPALGGGVNDFAYHHFGFTLQHSKEMSFYVASVLFAITTIVAVAFMPDFGPPHRTQHHEVEGGFSFHDFWIMLSRIPMMLLMTFTTFLGIGLIMAYFKVFTLEQFSMSETRFGLLLIGPALIIAALAVPLGTLGDRIGKALAVKIGIGMCAGSYWLLLLFFHEWTLVLFGSLLGVGFVIAFPAWMALVTTDCNPGQRGAVVGAVGTAQGVGAIAGVGISSLLYKVPGMTIGRLVIPKHGWPFIGCAVMLAAAFLLALATVHDGRSCPSPGDPNL